MLQSEMKRSLPWFAILVVLLGTALVLRGQGRLWWCSCDYLLFWSGDPWSSDNSQHLLDPYSFTHLLHGFLLCGLLALIARRLGFRRTFALFVLTEVALALWIRDNLTLNVVMLIHPIEAIKEWQAAGH